MITALSAAEPKAVVAIKGIDGTSIAGSGLLLSANRGVPLAVCGHEFVLAHGLEGQRRSRVDLPALPRRSRRRAGEPAAGRAGSQYLNAVRRRVEQRLGQHDDAAQFPEPGTEGTTGRRRGFRADRVLGSEGPWTSRGCACDPLRLSPATRGGVGYCVRRHLGFGEPGCRRDVEGRRDGANYDLATAALDTKLRPTA